MLTEINIIQETLDKKDLLIPFAYFLSPVILAIRHLAKKPMRGQLALTEDMTASTASQNSQPKQGWETEKQEYDKLPYGNMSPSLLAEIFMRMKNIFN